MVSSTLFAKVNPKYISQIEEKGMKFVGRDVEGERMEIMEIKGMVIEEFFFLLIEGWAPF